MLQGPGENAGVISIGDGLAVAFKIESHNHPSAVEPYQGAATGVGGILRDVFTMGARPIALLNSLRFGSLDSPRVRGPVRRRREGHRRLRQLRRHSDGRRRDRLRSRLRGKSARQRHVRRAAARDGSDSRRGRRRRQRDHGRGRAHGTRWHSRRIVRERGSLRRERGEAAHGAGGRSVHREAACSRRASSSSPAATSSPFRTWARRDSPRRPPRWRRAAMWA